MATVLRFGSFEIDVASGELRRDGRRVKLQEQPFQVLLHLVQRPGQVVTREELQQGVWCADTFVDFDHGVNTAIKKIRLALGDSAENPQFIETLPRKGYRFIAPVMISDGTIQAAAPERQSRWLLVAIGSAALLGALALWLFAEKRIRQTPLTIIPFTTYPGREVQPSFSPDGNHVAFAWNAETQDNFDIYVKQIGSEQPLRLTFRSFLVS